MATKVSTPRRASTTRSSIQQLDENDLDMPHDLVEYFKEYAREKPEVVALWCLGIGFIVGWKLKPW